MSVEVVQHPIPRAPARKFPLVDSMRGLAALAIVVYHGAYGAALLPDPLEGVVRALIANLYVGVTVFFVISGFLLYRPFAAALFGDRPAVSVTGYAVRRVARIVPGYWVALTVVAVVLGLGYIFEPKQALVYFGFGQLYRSETAFQGIGPAWSLCVEVAFYAALPLIAAAIGLLPGTNRAARLRNQLGVLLLLFLGSIAWNAWAALAWLSFRFVELPAIRMGTRVGRYRRDASRRPDKAGRRRRVRSAEEAVSSPAGDLDVPG